MGTLAWLLGLGLTLVVVVRLLGVERGTILALLVGALPLTLLPAYGLLALALLLRRVRLALLSMGLVLAHVLVILPTLGASDLPPGTEAAPPTAGGHRQHLRAEPDPGAGRSLAASVATGCPHRPRA